MLRSLAILAAVCLVTGTAAASDASLDAATLKALGPQLRGLGLPSQPSVEGLEPGAPQARRVASYTFSQPGEPTRLTLETRLVPTEGMNQVASATLRGAEARMDDGALGYVIATDQRVVLLSLSAYPGELVEGLSALETVARGVLSLTNPQRRPLGRAVISTGEAPAGVYQTFEPEVYAALNPALRPRVLKAPFVLVSPAEDGGRILYGDQESTARALEAAFAPRESLSLSGEADEVDGLLDFLATIPQAKKSRLEELSDRVASFRREPRIEAAFDALGDYRRSDDRTFYSWWVRESTFQETVAHLEAVHFGPTLELQEDATPIDTFERFLMPRAPRGAQSGLRAKLKPLSELADMLKEATEGYTVQRLVTRGSRTSQVLVVQDGEGGCFAVGVRFR